MTNLLELPGVVGWTASVTPLVILLWILWRDPFGGWKNFHVTVGALVLTAVSGALLVDMEDGTRSLFLTFMWGLGRVTLLFAAISVFSAFYPKSPLSPTPWNLTMLVFIAFVLALWVDPLLSLIAVIYHVLRLRGPAITVVAATIATLLGSAVFTGFGPFGSFVQATQAQPLGFQLLWDENQVRVTIVVTLLILMFLHYFTALLWARENNKHYKFPTGYLELLRPHNGYGFVLMIAGFAALVIAQYTLPDIHERMAEALWNKLQGKSYRIREEWWELIPWREVAYVAIGVAATVFGRYSQEKNKFGFAPIWAAAWVMMLLHLAGAPFMTVLFEQRHEWPTLLQVAYELLGWIRTQLPERWMVQLFALVSVFILGLMPAFAALALISHDGRLSGGDMQARKGKIVRLTPFGAIKRASLLLLIPGSIIGFLILG